MRIFHANGEMTGISTRVATSPAAKSTATNTMSVVRSRFSFGTKEGRALVSKAWLRCVNASCFSLHPGEQKQPVAPTTTQASHIGLPHCLQRSVASTPGWLMQPDLVPSNIPSPPHGPFCDCISKAVMETKFCCAQVGCEPYLVHAVAGPLWCLTFRKLAKTPLQDGPQVEDGLYSARVANRSGVLKIL